MVKIPEGWIETTLGEVAEIIMGQSPKGESYNINGDGMPFYQGVTEFSDKFVGLKTYTTEPTKIIKPGTILFSVRAPVGRVNFTKREACIGRGNAGLNMNNGNQEYLFYLLKHIESQILRSSSGTVFDSISGKELQKISIIIPENPEEQKAIAKVLSSFDDKIELLRAENQTLEEMGQTLFKERFGKYKVGDELPDGWKVGKIYDKLVVDYGYPFKSSLFNSDKKGLPLIRIRDLKEGNPDVYTDEICPSDYEVLAGDILAGMDAEFKPVIWKGKKGLLNQRVCRFRPKTNEGNFFILEFIRPFLNFYEKTKVGTTVSHLGKSDLDIIETIIPPKELIDKFSELTNPIFKKIVNNNEKIKSLSETRNQLLPKLMSGEVRVEF